MKTGWKQKKIIFILLFGMFVCLFRVELLTAASASIVLTTKEASVDKGEKVHVIVSIEADSEIGDFEAYVKYDKSYLKFLKGGSYIQEDGDLLKISHVGDTEGETFRRYAIEFVALKKGKSKVSLKEKIALTELESGSAMSLSMNDVTVTVEAPLPSPSPSKVTPLPTETKKEEKQEKKEETAISPSKEPTKEIEESEGITVKLNKKDSTLLLKGSYQYRIAQVKTKQYIPEGYIATKIKINGISVNAYHNPKEDSDFVLLYLQNAEEEFGYYRYDTKEKTMQRFQQEIITSSVAEWSPDQVMLEKYREKVKTLYLVVGVFAILLVSLSILSVWLLNKKQRR